MSEPAALDLAAIREVLRIGHRACVAAECTFVAALDALTDELERCRAERDALRAALTKSHPADGCGDNCWHIPLEEIHGVGMVAITDARFLREQGDTPSRIALGEMTQ